MKIKEYVYGHSAVRIICYAAIALALLFVWLDSDGGSVAFVYNEF